MGLFSIIIASSLASRREGECWSDPEDPEKGRRETELAVSGGDDDEQQNRGPGPKRRVKDDNESVDDSDPKDVDEDEPEEPSPPGRRVTFGSPSGGSGPPSEKGDTKPRLLNRLKAFIFPPRDEGKPLSNYRFLPIMSGLVIPFSILLEIPSLTDSWRIRTHGNVTIQTQPKPPLLDVGLAISMFSALVANISLICRFMERGPVLVTTLITIASLTIHDLINIVALVVFGVQHRPDDSFTYGQGYWMTACSTIVSTATNLSLIWDLCWTRNFTKSGSGVSPKQRSLLTIVMFLLVYLALGALVNSLLIDLNFIDALYFTVVSIETVGFGDIVPDNTGSRVFMCFYIIFGILTLGVAVGVARETIFEQLHVSYQRRLARVRINYRERRRWRAWERKWKRAVEWRLKEIPAEVWIPDLTEDSDLMMDRAKEESKWNVILFIGRVFHTGFRNQEHYKLFREKGEIRGVTRGHPGTHLNVEALPRAQLEAAAVESGIPLCVVRALRRRRVYLSRTQSVGSGSSASIRQLWRRWFSSNSEPLPTEVPATPFMKGLEDMSGMLTKFAIATTGIGMNRMPLSANTITHGVRYHRHSTLDSTISETTTHSNGSRFTSSDDLREITNHEERKAFWAKLVVAWSLFMVFWLVSPDIVDDLDPLLTAEQVGAASFVATEKWTFGIAVYFCFITFTTTGYGDYSPKTPAGRSVFVFWALLGLATMTTLVSVLQDAFSSRYKSALYSGVFENAVKKYRQKTKAQNEKKAQEEDKQELNIFDKVRPSAVEESSARAQHTLEDLPERVLEQARVFHQHIQYIVQAEPEGAVTPDLKLMLDDIGRVQKLDERVKDEILENKDARNALSMLSFERALRELIDVAESTRSALTERDIMMTRYKEQQQVNECQDPEHHASGSGTWHHGVSHYSDAS
ncbi:hypothetical protein BDM02DRAFT_2784109 [Thelephora ganbajun]|uniref:Uncharacterized protein n=1 Tax=Thelephora ganbajun TaxID=370292 RepID=A0ACB6ZT13_THEGA|nr:hypothetical protein BDM02DRAFT_2784109 [Thelephora ganbajun]